MALPKVTDDVVGGASRTHPALGNVSGPAPKDRPTSTSTSQVTRPGDDHSSRSFWIPGRGNCPSWDRELGLRWIAHCRRILDGAAS